jgi:FkbM family methyltransferase
MYPALLQTIKGLGLEPPQGIVQVGASSGQELGEFLEYGIRRGVFIEPLPEPYQMLAAQCRRIPDFIAVNALCTAHHGEAVDFYVASNGGQSSSTLKPMNHLAEFSFVRFDGKLRLVGHQLDAILEFVRQSGHEAACAGMNLLYMDTQGSELQVLKGASTTLKQVDYVISEVTRNQMYEGAPTLCELTGFLNQHDFALNNVNFNRQHHADALFIKRTKLRLTTGF